jgi:hypothetical protein
MPPLVQRRAQTAFQLLDLAATADCRKEQLAGLGELRRRAAASNVCSSSAQLAQAHLLAGRGQGRLRIPGLRDACEISVFSWTGGRYIPSSMHERLPMNTTATATNSASRPGLLRSPTSLAYRSPAARAASGSPWTMIRAISCWRRGYLLQHAAPPRLVYAFKASTLALRRLGESGARAEHQLLPGAAAA